TQGHAGAIYTVTVSNPSTAPSSGFVYVYDTTTAGLTLVSMAGTGWTCPPPPPPPTTSYCYRSDALAAGGSYPAITVTVNVAASAASPQVNSVSVFGGSLGNSTATDSTIITINAPPNDEVGTATVITSLPASLSEDTTYATSN